LDVALDGDFRDREVRSDQFVGLARRQQAQDFRFAITSDVRACADAEDPRPGQSVRSLSL
jgi:hypothetical protein